MNENARIKLGYKKVDIFRRTIGYAFMLMRIYRDSGIISVLHNIRHKLKRGRQESICQMNIQDWLSFYQRRLEVEHQNIEKSSENIPKISILILTYNNLAISQMCLHSIYCNTTYQNFEVIVVDNASSDETPQWLNEFKKTHTNMKVILNSNNRGFAGGNNQAAKEATGQYLLFLNNDTIVTRGWLEKFFKHIRNDPRIGLIGPVTNATGNEARIPVDYCLPSEMESFAVDLADKMAGRYFDIRMLAFFCVMTRKDQFEAIGGLDERYGVGMFEDDDLARRYQEKGYRVVCAEDVFIHHFHGASFGKLDSNIYNQLFEENRRKYEQKWGNPWQPYQFRQTVDLGLSVNNNSGHVISSEMLTFKCNICGQTCKRPVADLEREKPSCACGSTVRSRSIIHLLSTELFGHSLALPDFPERHDLRGWGMSDAGYCDLLSRKLDYLNTFYHKPPYLDILAPLEQKKEGSLDFLISTEVFEHIEAPVLRGFVNARRLLKPEGFLILTVPYTLEPATQEHFPELYQYKIMQQKGRQPIMENITKDGRRQVFDNLVFHGGPGATLEMRVFSKEGLLNELKMAGFQSIKICSEPYLDFGIYWRDLWSLPLIARKSDLQDA